MNNSLKRSVAFLAVVSIVLLLAVAVPDVFSDTSAYSLGTLTFTAVAPPSILPICTGLCMQVTYKNNLNFSNTGIVYTVIHNSIGQTSSIQTATITPAGGQDSTAFFQVSFGLSSGTYNATVFVTTVGGVAISETSTIGFTIRSP